MYFRLLLITLIYSLTFIVGINDSYSQEDISPLDYLLQQEKKFKETKGEVPLGRVMTIHYPAYAVDIDEKYHPYILELTDILKTPLRERYRLVLKGYSDNSGDAHDNLEISVKRAETLKDILVKKYYMDEERISTEGYGESDPVATNDTQTGRMLNRRVEIYIFGDVSQAVRFIELGEEKK